MNGSIHNKIYHDFSNVNAKLKIGIFFQFQFFFRRSVENENYDDHIYDNDIHFQCNNAKMHCR